MMNNELFLHLIKTVEILESIKKQDPKYADALDLKNKINSYLNNCKIFVKDEGDFLTISIPGLIPNVQLLQSIQVVSFDPDRATIDIDPKGLPQLETWAEKHSFSIEES